MKAAAELQSTIDATGPAPQSSTWALPLVIHGGAGAALEGVLPPLAGTFVESANLV